jgi:hypothetical protein
METPSTTPLSAPPIAETHAAETPSTEDPPPVPQLLETPSTEDPPHPPPPPLLKFLEEYPGLFRDLLLTRLDPPDRAVLAQVGWPWQRAVAAAAAAAVVDSGLPWAGKSAGVPLKVKDFVGTVGLLAWARANGCPWTSWGGVPCWCLCDECPGCSGGAPGSVAVGNRRGLPFGLVHMCIRRFGRAL